MQLDRKPRAARGGEHASDLVGRERNPLAKPVDGVNQAFAGQLRDHRVGYISDIDVAVVAEFWRQSVRAQESHADRDMALFGEPACDGERFALGGKVEPVAGFDFDRADTLGDKSVQSPQRRLAELAFARGASRSDSGKNSPAFASDLLIRSAGKPELEFVRPVAAVNEVCMAIDQGGRNPAAFAIDEAGARAPRGRKLVLPANKSDASFARGDGAGFDNPDPRAPFDEGRKTGVQPNRVETVFVACLHHGPQRLPAADRFMLRLNRPKGKRPVGLGRSRE